MYGIEGKVAKIIDIYSVVINKGSIDGVEDEMRFIIYDKGEEIFDPDTLMSLGNLEYVKAKVKITYVSENYSIAETYEGGFSDSPYSRMIPLIRGEYERKELPLDEPLISSLPKKSTIKVGDLVRQYLE